jgi:hypothetical protein
MWFPTTKYFGDFTEQQAREYAGYYPQETVPPQIVTFLMPRIMQAKALATEPRLLQPLLSLMVCMLPSTIFCRGGGWRGGDWGFRKSTPFEIYFSGVRSFLLAAIYFGRALVYSRLRSVNPSRIYQRYKTQF